MLSLKNRQAGISHVVAILFILAIGVIGTVAIRTSSAHRANRIAPVPPPQQVSRPTVCRSNGATIVAPAGQSCSISQDASGVHCMLNGAEAACTSNSGGSTSTSTQGTPGTTSNTTTSTVTQGSNGGGGTSVCSANGHQITAQNCSISSDSSGVHCKINGAEVPCDQ